MLYELLLDLNNYEPITELGKGTFGTAHLIKDKKIGKIYVAKVFDHLSDSLEDQKTFFKELELQKSLKTPEILSVVGFSQKDFTNESHPTIIYNCFDNKAEEILKKLPQPDDKFEILTKPERYILVFAIANGLDYMHSKDILHLNLKPNNILIDAQKYPRICDSFDSRKKQIHEYLRMNKDALPYMAPEIINGKKGTKKSDVYSFAMIAYEILTGDRSLSNMAKNLSFEQIQNMRNMIPGMNDISNDYIKNYFRKCWSSNPDERPSFDEIINELRKDVYKKWMNVSDRDFEKYYMFKYFEKAEKHKDPEAMNAYACLLEQGISAPVPLDKVIIYYKKAIEKGNDKAMFNYGRMLYFGDCNVTKDVKEGIRLWEMAVDKGNTYAMSNYAYLLYFGENIPVNIEKAMTYYNFAVSKGNIFAIHNLAFIYRSGYKMARKDIHKAIEIYKLGIDLNDPVSMCNYAEILRFGECGIPVDKKKAAELYQMAIDQGNVDAMCKYADMLRLNECGKSDKEKAIELYKRAKTCGSEYAQKQLAEMILKGEADVRDNDEHFKVIKISIIKFYDGVPIKNPEEKYYKKYDNS